MSSVANLSSAVSNRQFVTTREEVLVNFRPQNTIPLVLHPRRHNRVNRSSVNIARGRPRNVLLQLNHILLFKNNSWRNLKPPRENNNKWNELVNNRCIVTNITFNEDILNSINDILSDAYSLSFDDNWLILNGSTNQLKIASSQVIFSDTKSLNLYI